MDIFFNRCIKRNEKAMKSIDFLKHAMELCIHVFPFRNYLASLVNPVLWYVLALYTNYSLLTAIWVSLKKKGSIILFNLSRHILAKIVYFLSASRNKDFLNIKIFVTSCANHKKENNLVSVSLWRIYKQVICNFISMFGSVCFERW